MKKKEMRIGREKKCREIEKKKRTKGRKRKAYMINMQMPDSCKPLESRPFMSPTTCYACCIHCSNSDIFELAVRAGISNLIEDLSR